MENNFTGNNIESKDSVKDSPNHINNTENPLENNSKEEFGNKINIISNQKNLPKNAQFLEDQFLPENTKIYEISTNLNNDNLISEEKINEIIQKTGKFPQIMENNNVGNSKITTTTTTTIIRDGKKITTTNTQNTNIDYNKNNELNNEINIKNEVNMLPTLSNIIISKEDNNSNNQENQDIQSNKIKTHKRGMDNILIDNNNEQYTYQFTDNVMNINQKMEEENDDENEIDNNINNNKIIFGASNNNNINNEIKQEINNFGSINFGAPDDDIINNYTPLSSNVKFGVKINKISNQNNNDNELNYSSSVDKSSEMGYITIGQKNENEQINNSENIANSSNVKFGYNENNKENINATPQKSSFNLNNDGIVQFGFVEIKEKSENNINKKNEIINNKDEMDIELGEFKENNINDKNNKNINILIEEEVKIKEKEEKNEKVEKVEKREKSEKNEKKDKNEKNGDKNENKKNQKEIKETIFVKKLFDDQGQDKGTEGFFNQKLFPNNDDNITNNNEGMNQNGKSLFGGLFINNNIFISSFDNNKTKEIFFQNNKVEKNITSNSFNNKDENKMNIIKKVEIKKEDKPLFNNIFSSKSNNTENEEEDVDMKEGEIKHTLNNIINKTKEDISKKNLFSPLTTYINENKDKNFILGDNKEKNNTNIFNSSNIFSNNNNSSNTNSNPFSDLLSNSGNKNTLNQIILKEEEKKQEIKNQFLEAMKNTNKTGDNKEEKKEENKNQFLEATKNANKTDTGDNEINKENIANTNNKSDKKENENQKPFNIFDSEANLEAIYNSIDNKKEENKKDENKKEENKNLDNKIETTIIPSSSLYQKLNLQKSNTDINIAKNPTTSSLFPGLGLQKGTFEEKKETKTPLFPGLNLKKNTISSTSLFADKNNAKPIFPGNLDFQKSKSSLFSDFLENKNKSLFKVENENLEEKNKTPEKVSEIKTPLPENSNKNDNENKDIDNSNVNNLSISFGGSIPKITATSKFGSQIESNGFIEKNDNNNDKNKNIEDNCLDMSVEEKNIIKNKINSLNKEDLDDFIKFLNEKEKDFVLNINIFQLNIEEISNDKLKKLEKYFNEYKDINNKPKMHDNDNLFIKEKEKVEFDEKELNSDKSNIPTLNQLIKDKNLILDKDNNKEGKNNNENKDGDIEMKDKNINNNINSKKDEQSEEDIEIEIDIDNKKNKNPEYIKEKKEKGDIKKEEKKSNIQNIQIGSFFTKEKKEEKSKSEREPKKNEEMPEKQEKKSLFGDFFQNKDISDLGFESLLSKSNSGILFNDKKEGSIFGSKNESIWGSKNKGLFNDNTGGGIFETKLSGGLFGDKKEINNKNDIRDNKDKIILDNDKNNNVGLYKNNNIIVNEETKKLEDSDNNFNLFNNNDGKSLFGEINEGNNKNLKFFNTETTPIKSNTFFNNDNEKEKLDNEKFEKEQLEKERKEQERLEQETLEQERLEQEKKKNQETEEIEEDEISQKEKIIDKCNEIEEVEIEEEEIEKEEEKKEEKEQIFTQENDKNENGEEEKQEEIEIEIKKNQQKIPIQSNNSKEEKNIVLNELEYSNEDEEEEELSQEEEEYNPNKKEQNIIYSQNINNNNNNQYLIFKEFAERKPLRIEMYSNLIQKMYEITNKRKNKINDKEKYIQTIYINNLNEYLKDLEDKIILMKKIYINTLVKKHFEKDKNKKMKIILKANVSKYRNDVKKIFKKLMGYIKDKLVPENQKYYYLQILNIFNNNEYKNITRDEIGKEFVSYKQKIFSNQKNDYSNDNKEKDENKDNKNDYDDDILIGQQNSKKGIFFKLFTVLLPLAYVANYVFANFKD